MAIGNKKLAAVLKIAAKSAEAAGAQSRKDAAVIAALKTKIAENEKLARARAIATSLIVGDDVRRDIDDQTLKMASQDLDVIEKAIELGRTESVLKIGEAIHSQNESTKNRGEQALMDLLATLL